jgi:hypothetical protein
MTRLSPLKRNPTKEIKLPSDFCLEFKEKFILWICCDCHENSCADPVLMLDRDWTSDEVGILT